MNTVILHQFLIQDHVSHKKLDPRNLVFRGEFPVDVFKSCRVASSVIRRNPDPEQHNSGAGALASANDLVEIAFHAFGRKTPEAIIAAEFEDDQRGAEVTESPLDPGSASLGRIPADTGVDHAMFVPLVFESRLQQRGPGLVNVYSISCTKAIAEHEYSWRFRAVCGRTEKKDKKDNKYSHGQSVNR